VSARQEGNKAFCVARWIFIWVILTTGIVIFGAVAGGLIFPAGGFLLGLDLEPWVMIRNGVLDGGFYALIWAPGISFVVCVLAIHTRRSENSNKET